MDLIAADEARARKLEILTSIPGIRHHRRGLLAMPELGALSGKAAASLARPPSPRVGMAGPGLHPGRTGAGATAPVHAGGGRPELEPRLGRGDRRLRSAARSKVALVAVMRKLIVLANTLVRQDRTWLPVAPRATF